MKKQFLRVPLICFSACVMMLDLSLVIDLLNMGAQERSTLFTLCCVAANLALLAGWIFYFWKKPFDGTEDI